MKKLLFVVAALLLFMSLWQAPLLRDLAYLSYLNITQQTELSVTDDTLTINGIINAQTPAQLIAVFEQHPNINRVVMLDVPGSVDDEANIAAAHWIAQKKLTFVLDKNSVISSGGTDFFLAGKQRIIHQGAKIGVHSWGGVEDEATDYPDSHPFHQPYIDYYKAIGLTAKQASEFYFFTINSAPADGMHWMTESEVLHYQIATRYYATN